MTLQVHAARGSRERQMGRGSDEFGGRRTECIVVREEREETRNWELATKARGRFEEAVGECFLQGLAFRNRPKDRSDINASGLEIMCQQNSIRRYDVVHGSSTGRADRDALSAVTYCYLIAMFLSGQGTPAVRDSVTQRDTRSSRRRDVDIGKTVPRPTLELVLIRHLLAHRLGWSPRFYLQIFSANAVLPAQCLQPIGKTQAVAHFFMASLTAHHLTPPPTALLPFVGINTFRRRFFNSSALLAPEPITEAQVIHHLSAPVSTRTTAANNAQVFHVDKILQDGAENTTFALPSFPISDNANDNEFPREYLYDYYLDQNEFPNLVGDIDTGYQWAETKLGKGGPLRCCVAGRPQPSYKVMLTMTFTSM
ncbi:hypothetical protein CORC01_12023 [Colletotrichum orchidophilum]|uniref:Uncharacterized protein n=1 Tax=Colletotrichum orchidophilum TaxID=1209926 RepID=A0A1G4AU43_9PEZI|nr:uncharacterized protein CORC01_12023 [Colletotrichum orchidophilum]OHE92689.1 hypothetical protein CORC01_12023 [Colletotrichum orchidophilum]